ncbi:MAG TPA: hypothetical protein VHK89_10730 [Actinomycetota bacterium]|nr:hypothetical protein [Actinomycetota bacterium]
MAEALHTPRRERAGSFGRRAQSDDGLPPAAAFAIVLLAIAALTGLWALERAPGSGARGSAAAVSRPGSREQPSPHAIRARFERLRALFVRSYHQRDTSLIRLYAAPDAPDLTSGAEIRWLLRNDILDRTRWVSRALRVAHVGPTRAVLRERLLFLPRFVHLPSGTDAAPDAIPQVRAMEWTMTYEDGRWLLYSGRALRETPLPRRGAP